MDSADDILQVGKDKDNLQAPAADIASIGNNSGLGDRGKHMHSKSCRPSLNGGAFDNKAENSVVGGLGVFGGFFLTSNL